GLLESLQARLQLLDFRIGQLPELLQVGLIRVASLARITQKSIQGIGDRVERFADQRFANGVLVPLEARAILGVFGIVQRQTVENFAGAGFVIGYGTIIGQSRQLLGVIGLPIPSLAGHRIVAVDVQELKSSAELVGFGQKR